MATEFQKIRAKLPSDDEITKMSDEQLLNIWKLSNNCNLEPEFRSVTDDFGFTPQDDYYDFIHTQLQLRKLSY